MGEIKIDKEGKYIYAANRGHNSISVFAVDPTEGTLSLVQYCPTHGNTPRHFGLSDSGAHLVAANQDSGNLHVFKRNEDGSLSSTGTVVEVPTPNFVLFYQPC